MTEVDISVHLLRSTFLVKDGHGRCSADELLNEQASQHRASHRGMRKIYTRFRAE